MDRQTEEQTDRHVDRQTDRLTKPVLDLQQVTIIPCPTMVYLTQFGAGAIVKIACIMMINKYFINIRMNIGRLMLFSVQLRCTQLPTITAHNSITTQFDIVFSESALVCSF